MDAATFQSMLVAAVLTFLLAGLIKGTVGLGLPTTAIGILSQIADPRLAITVAIFPILAGNSWQAVRGGHVRETARRFWPFALTLAIVLLGTAMFVTEISTDALVIVLGLVIVLFSVTNLAFTPPQLPARYDTLGQIVAGAASGVLGGLTAMWAPPMLIYFVSRRIEREEFVRATGALFLTGAIPLLIGYLYNGLLDGYTALLSAILIVPTLIGFTAGEWIRRRMDASRFRSAVLILFLLMGLNLLRRALF